MCKSYKGFLFHHNFPGKIKWNHHIYLDNILSSSMSPKHSKNYLISPRTCSQIWLSPLVDDCQPPLSQTWKAKPWREAHNYPNKSNPTTNPKPYIDVGVYVCMWDMYRTNYLGFGLNWMVMSLMAKVKLFICISRIRIRAFFLNLVILNSFWKFSNKIAKLVKFTLEKYSFPNFPNSLRT
jgi:hypothetical protein